MATKREIEENNKLLREQNELLKQGRVISEETLDDNRDFANILRDQTKEIQFQISEKNQLRSIGNSLNKIAQEAYGITHEEIADLKTAKTLLDFQKKVKKDILGLESLRGKIIVENDELQKSINDNIEEQIKSAKALNDQLTLQRDVSEQVANNFGVKTFGFIEDITKAIPGLRKLSKPFEDAAKASREAAAQNIIADKFLKSENIGRKDQRDIQKGLNKLTEYNLKTGSGLNKDRLEYLNLTKITGKTEGADAAKLLRAYTQSASKVGVMKAGFKALGPAVKAGLGPLGLIMLAVNAVKMIIDLFIAADANTTAIAKNLGISKANAEGIRKEFIKTAAESDNLLVNSKSLLEAQGQLTQAIGATTLSSQKLAENQVFLTKNLGIAGDKASQMQLMFNATGQEMNSVIDSTIEYANEQAKSNGYLISGQEIMREISNTSAEVAGYYGFNNKALSRAIVLSRQYGLNLMQTQSISKGLLSFESSIAAELEAELLSGKELNFEKARMLALTGDSAGAAAEVLKQAQDLTEEQRKNPILMQSMAKATGLSVQELNKAFLLEKNLKMERKDYNDLLAKGAALGKQELVEQLGLQGASRAEIEKTLTAQEAFAAALAKAKDSFTNLVDSGVIDDLISYLPKLLEAVASLAGIDTLSEEKRKQLEESGKNIASQDLSKMGISKSEYKSLVEKATLNKGAFGLTSDWAFATNAGIEEARQKIKQLSAKIEPKSDGELNVNDFQIKTHPKDTLVMAGGTKFGEETNSLLKDLIDAVSKGGNVYLNGNQVGQAMTLSQYKSS